MSFLSTFITMAGCFLLYNVELFLFMYNSFPRDLSVWILTDLIQTDVGLFVVVTIILYYGLNEYDLGTRLVVSIMIIFSVIKFIWIVIGTIIFYNMYTVLNLDEQVSMYSILSNGLFLVWVQYIFVNRFDPPPTETFLLEPVPV